MKVSDFDYQLPRERIAQRPLPDRDASRMLLLDRQTGAWEDHQFQELPDVLRGDELIVVNAARVIPARLFGRRAGMRAQPPGKQARLQREFLSAPIEVLLTRQLEPFVWEALVHPGRKLPTGELVVFGDGELEAEIIGRAEYGQRTLRFRSREDLPAVLERLGHTPLPPYIDRPDESSDRERYQTLFAKHPGAVAAPTASLHFTERIVDRLRAEGSEICEITLEVGLGTFQPIRCEEMEQHRIHRENYEIPEATAVAVAAARRDGRPILAVGTTVVRALEDAAEKCAARSPERGVAASEFLPASGKAEAHIFIYPGYEFRVVNALLTNFHLPKSSLLAMVAAFAGREHILAAYRHAVEQGYRFYSYGDCMLIR
jgi:S-adenosylmethionine:tRNA ribosyltransferase-isomerase